VIRGRVPDLADRPTGCSFRERCDRALPRCATDDPGLTAHGAARAVACHNPLPAEGVA
jgi:peptide/nickel transport system ATP-binding protein